MVLTSWGRAGALAVAGLLIALTAVYVGAWMYYAGGPAPATARLGIEYEFPPGTSSALITVVDARSPAAAAGLRPGDHLLAIEGEPAASERPFEQSIRFGQPGTPVRLTLRRQNQDEPIEATAVLAQPPPAVRTFDPQMITENVLRLYPLGFFAVVVVLLLQRPQDRNAWLVSLLFVGFIAAAPLDPEVAHPALRTFGMTFKIVFYTLVPAFFFYLFAVFPVRSPIDRRWPWLKRPFLALGSALAALLLARAVPEGSWAPIERTVSLQALTPVGTLLMAYAVAGIVLGATSLVWSYASTGDADVRRRIGVIVWGTAVSVTPFLVLQTIAGSRDVFSTFPFWAWAPAVLCLFLLPIAFVYAVVKYRVIEIPLLLKRSARYLLVQRGLVLLVAAIGTAATLVLAWVSPRLVPDRPDLAVPWGLVVGVGFGLALAWAGARVQRGVSSRIDRAFFRSAYDARRILEELAARAAGTTSRDELAALLEQCLADALRPAGLVVYLEHRGGTLRAMSGRCPPELAALDRSAPGLQLLGGTREPLAIEIREDEPHPMSLLAPLSPELVAPITSRGGVLLGLLVLGRRRSDEPYSGEDRRLLSAVCVQAGLALENVALAEQMAERLESERRAERDLTIAHEVQLRLLPQAPPVVSTLDLRGLCLQARAVGGDYYDFLDLGDGRLALVLADISGKGISAALLMANLQAHLRAQYLLARDDVTRLLTRIDRFMFEATAPYHFATMFFGCYDEVARRLVYANCGHNPPLLLRAGGGVEWLTPTAPAVGLFPTWACTTGEVRIASADTLLVYTDGVTEAMDDDGECYGEERLLEVAYRVAGAPLDDVVTAIVGEVQRFSGAVQEDDLTLVVARGR